MTVQIGNSLTNHCPKVDLSGLVAGAVLTGDPTRSGGCKAYKYATKPDPAKLCITTACWAGHTCRYELTEEGHLKLIGFDYPFTHNESDDACEQFVGDFWLMLRAEYYGDRLYVSFRDGELKPEEMIWIDTAGNIRPALHWPC